MKIFVSAVAVCVLALVMSGTVSAGGCDRCNQGDSSPQSLAPSDPLRKFQLDTIDLRQAMMNKRFELQRENLKGTPDAGKTAGLKAEIKSIQTKISEIRVQSGLPDEGKRDGECFKMDGGCGKQGSMGGCNGQPCGQK